MKKTISTWMDWRKRGLRARWAIDKRVHRIRATIRDTYMATAIRGFWDGFAQETMRAVNTIPHQGNTKVP